MDSSELALKVGDLLIRGNILTLEELEDAVKLADKMRQPLERILHMNGYCAEKNLGDAINIQDKINDKTLTLESGVKAIEMVIRQGMDVDAAIRKLNPVAVQRQEAKAKNVIGDLLASTNVITQKQLAEGINHTLNTHLPLGMVLVDMGAVSVHVLECAVTLLEYVRDRVISQEQCSHALRLARFKRLSAQDAILEDTPNFVFPERPFGLKEVLVLSGIITENQLLTARELELVDKHPVLENIVKIGFVSQLCMDATIQMVQMVEEGSLTLEQGLMIMRKLRHARNEAEMEHVLTNIDDIIEEEKVVEISQILIESGLVSGKEIEIATPLAIQSKRSLNRVLVDAGFLDDRTVGLVAAIKELIEQNVLGMEQAKIALVYSVEHNTTLDDTLRLFGWWQTIAQP